MNSKDGGHIREIATLGCAVQALQTEVTKMSKTIYGNGKKGLYDVVSEHLTEHKTERKSYTNIIFIVGFLITNLIAILASKGVF